MAKYSAADQELSAQIEALRAENAALSARLTALEDAAKRPVQQTARPVRTKRPHVPCDTRLKRTAPIFAQAACKKLSEHLNRKCWVQVLGDDLFQITKGLDEPSAKVDGRGLTALVNQVLAQPKAKTLEQTLETPPWSEAA